MVLPVCGVLWFGLCGVLLSDGLGWPLQWLEEEAWHRRLGACLVLRELAKQAGNSLFTQMTEVLQSIVRIVHDPRLDIREAAADALTLCLEMLAKRREMKRPPGRSYLDW